MVYERCFGCLDGDGQHAAMSMTTSVTGLLVEILVAEGALDDSLMVRFACDPRAQNGFIAPTSLPAYRVVAEVVMARE